MEGSQSCRRGSANHGPTRNLISHPPDSFPGGAVRDHHGLAVPRLEGAVGAHRLPPPNHRPAPVLLHRPQRLSAANIAAQRKPAVRPRWTEPPELYPTAACQRGDQNNVYFLSSSASAFFS